MSDHWELLGNESQRDLNEVVKYPVPRFGTPEDMAEAVAYLASPAAAYVTGE